MNKIFTGLFFYLHDIFKSSFTIRFTVFTRKKTMWQIEDGYQYKNLQEYIIMNKNQKDTICWNNKIGILSTSVLITETTLINK